MKAFSRWLVLCAAFTSLSFAADTNKVAATANAKGFYHPGVLLNRAQLEFIRDKVTAGAEPWKTALETAKASEWAALDYTPRPWQTCECGPRSNPNRGCKDEQRDSQASYTQAL